LVAQEAVVDTVRLLLPAKVEAIQTSTSPNSRFSVGIRDRLFTIEQLQPSNEQSLSDYLQRNSAVYIKEFGQGMGAYISIRGTSASHTSVQWNGMNVSMPTMGQTDFSHLPLFFFDAMELHIGGAGALYGNGSIGGSVQLSTTPLWKQGVSMQVKLGAGSFDARFAGANVRWSGNGWEGRTAALYSFAQNNFFFSNNTKIGKPRERQQHASSLNWGVLQELYKKIGARNRLSFHIWYVDFDRNVQPSVSNNDRPQTWTSLLDKNFKLSGTYRGNANHFRYSTQIGYARDYEKYEKEIIEADCVVGVVEGEYIRNRFVVKMGGNAAYTSPTGKAFESAAQEWRSDIYGLLWWKPTPTIMVNAGIRQSFVSALSLSSDPFVGAQWTFVQRGAHRLTIRGAFSQSHKIPTLNDRYWGGANSWLRPERGTTVESGVDYEAEAGGWCWSVNGTLYYSYVQDWIRWFPAGVVWRPQNIPVVKASGAEAAFSVKGSIERVKIGMDAHYAHTGITVKEGLWTHDPEVGHQLAFQPVHCFTAKANTSYRSVLLEVQSRYTGARTTNDIHDILPGYQVWNVQSAYTSTWCKHQCTFKINVNNLFNKDYQNVKFFAMPGRNYMVTIQYQL
jgi:iron complex outermembrane receptor protein